MSDKTEIAERHLQKAREVKAYVEEHGDLPGFRDPNGHWLCNRRRDAQNDRLNPEIREVLEAIPSWKFFSETQVPTANERDLETAREVVRFYQTEGRLPKRDEPLGKWLVSVRKRHRQKKLDPKVFEILEPIPGAFPVVKTKEDRLVENVAKKTEELRVAVEALQAYRAR